MKLRLMLTLTAALLLSASALSAHGVSVHAGSAIENCSDLRMTIDGRPAVISEERIAIGGSLLGVRLGEEGGIPLKVVGSDRSGYDVVLCKGAADASVLSQVRLTQAGSEISVSGPAGGEWGGHLLVFAPRNAELDIVAGNGPVAISDIAGRLNARVSNGPLSLKRVGGSVDVESKNGPVSFTGGSGNVSIASSNGPVTIRLEGTSWEGGELRTSAKNGPLTIRMPRGYASGLILERGARVPFRCPVELCGERPPFFQDDATRIEVGRGMPRIHVAATNGPVTIRNDE